METTNGQGPLPLQQLHQPHQMTARDYIKVLFRQKWIIIVTFVAVFVATVINLKLRTPLYEAQVKMLITAQKQVESPYFSDMSAGGRVQAAVMQSEIVKSKPVLERAVMATNLHARPLDYEKTFASDLRKGLIDRRIASMKLDKLSENQQKIFALRTAFESLKNNIRVVPIRETNMFVISVTDYHPVAAAVLANVVARSYIIFDLEQQYVELQSKYTDKNPIVVHIKATIEDMNKNLNGALLPNIEAIGPASVKVIEQATPPLRPIGLPEKLLLTLALVMGLGLGIFLAFVFEYVDQTFRSKPDLEGWLGLPVIACVNRKRGWGERKVLKNYNATTAPRATSYRILAQQLLFLSKTRKLNSIFFANIAQGEEASVILANVAKYMAEKLGLRTLIVDANFRNAHQHRLFRAAPDEGLAEVLEGRTKLSSAARKISQNLDLLTTGHASTDPGILLDMVTFRAFLGGAHEVYDMILIDGADLRDFRDTALIAPAADGVVLVIGESTVRRQVADYSIKPLRDNHARLIGAVMSNRHYVIPRFLYETV